MPSFKFSQLTTLVVEDSDFVRHLVKKYLVEMGFKTVHEASNGMDGIAQFEEHKPDIIVCDIEMEPLNGFELLKLLRKQKSPQANIPVIYLTSSADTEHVQHALDLGVSAYLLKPITPDSLKKKIIELMARNNV